MHSWKSDWGAARGCRGEDLVAAVAVRDGGFAAYAPINLAGIGAVNLRVKPVAGAAIELRLDSPDGAGLISSRSTDSNRHR